MVNLYHTKFVSGQADPIKSIKTTGEKTEMYQTWLKGGGNLVSFIFMWYSTNSALQIIIWKLWTTINRYQRKIFHETKSHNNELSTSWIKIKYEP